MTAESKERAVALLRRGVEMAQEQGRPWRLRRSLETAILALERDENEELVIRLLAVGYGWAETEVAVLRKRLADQLREQRRQAGRQKAGRTKCIGGYTREQYREKVRARVVELRAQGLQEQQIDNIIAEEFGVKGRTRRDWRKKFWQ